jgi:glycosyltransferase involved in cell wall biosynthesis
MPFSTEFTSIAPLSLDRVCVVIPAFNEETLVSRCVASVLRAGLAASQVFVIDDCSTDCTREVLADFDGINVIANPERLGKVRGLQRAIDICQLPERFEFMSRAPAHQAVQGTPPAVNRTR